MLAILSLIKNIIEAIMLILMNFIISYPVFYNLVNHITGEHFVSDFALSPLHLIG